MRPRLFELQRRFASQEINPILFRLNYQDKNQPLAFDRNPARTWSHVFYAPHKGSPMWNTYAPFTVQHLRMKKYLDGYFQDKAIIGTPHIYRTVAGNLVRLYIYNPENVKFDWANLEKTLSCVFGAYQGPGTSGRSRESNSPIGRVKVKLDIVDLPSPVLHAEILSQYVGRQLAAYINPSTIFDRLVATIDDTASRVADEPGADGLSVVGLRLRIKGRPKGEEMAVKHDFMHGSCPKQDQTALIDYGKHSIKLRSGLVGVKTWVHFQRPHRQDETGRPEVLNNILSSTSQGSGDQDLEVANDLICNSLLQRDMDYDPEKVAKYFNDIKETSEDRPGGLWNVTSGSDPQIANLFQLLKSIHEPDNPEFCRFIW